MFEARLRAFTTVIKAPPHGIEAPLQEENGMKTTVQMKKKITVRRSGDIRLTTSALCGDACYCTYVS
jgi:hypothetical protein